MKKNQQSNVTNNSKDAILSNLALLYYGEGLTQGEIAKRFKVSRATIVNMLKDCRERGIVDIRVDGQLLTLSSLARDLREKYGLTDVYVSIPSSDDYTLERQEQLEQLSRVAAMAIHNIIEPGDRVGVAWGETIAAVAKALPKNPLDGIEVCQLIGSQESERVPTSEFCSIEFANKLGANCHTLHAPGIVSTPELSQLLQRELTIKTQLSRLSNLDMTIASVGHMGDNTHMAAANIATHDDLKHARAKGTQGIICCRFIDKHGQEVTCAPTERLISASLENMRTAPKRVLIVCGAKRLNATLAAISGDLVSHLVIDKSLAEALLKA